MDVEEEACGKHLANLKLNEVGTWMLVRRNDSGRMTREDGGRRGERSEQNLHWLVKEAKLNLFRAEEEPD